MIDEVNPTARGQELYKYNANLHDDFNILATTSIVSWASDTFTLYMCVMIWHNDV